MKADIVMDFEQSISAEPKNVTACHLEMLDLPLIENYTSAYMSPVVPASLQGYSEENSESKGLPQGNSEDCLNDFLASIIITSPTKPSVVSNLEHISGGVVQEQSGIESQSNGQACPIMVQQEQSNSQQIDPFLDLLSSNPMIMTDFDDDASDSDSFPSSGDLSTAPSTPSFTGLQHLDAGSDAFTAGAPDISKLPVLIRKCNFYSKQCTQLKVEREKFLECNESLTLSNSNLRRALAEEGRSNATLVAALYKMQTAAKLAGVGVMDEQGGVMSEQIIQELNKRLQQAELKNFNLQQQLSGASEFDDSKTENSKEDMPQFLIECF